MASYLSYILVSTFALFSCAPETVQAFLPVSQGAYNGQQRLLESTQSEDQMTAYTNLKGLIFDIDGTLADSWKLGFDATLAVLNKNDVDTISEEEYHQFTRYCTPERLARHTGLEPSDEGFEEVGQRLGDEFDNLYVDLVSMETAGFYPGISELLEALPDSIALGALTNACVAYAHAVFRVNVQGAGSVEFKSIHGADSVPAPKPSAEGLWLVCKELGLKPEECVYVGDSPSDGLAAKNAGMLAIGVLWGSHSEER